MLVAMVDSRFQALLNNALDQFAIPGDASFPLNQAFEAPRDRQDAETLRQWVLTTLSQLKRLSLTDN